MFARAILSRGISTQHLAKNITLFVNDPTITAASTMIPHSAEDPQTLQSTSQTSRPAVEEPRPLLLMLPWLGSRPQSVAKYCDIYFRTGLDVMVVTSEVQNSFGKLFNTMFYENVICKKLFTCCYPQLLKRC